MPVIVDPDAARAQTVASSTGPRSHLLTSTEQVRDWLDRRANEYVVLLGPGVPLIEAAGLADQLRLERPAVSVVLVRTQGTATDLTTAMQAGIRDVVNLGDAAGITAAVTRAEETFRAWAGPNTAQSDGTVVTVFSPKGGVGKTTTAVNTALALSDHGMRKVCLVDLDLSFGDVAITLQLIPRHTITDAADFAENLDFSLLESLLTQHDSGVTVLAAPTTPDARDLIDADLVRRVIGILRQNFDFVVIDTAPGFEEQVLQALDESDECVIVTTLDVPTLKNAKLAIETLDVLKIAVGHRWLVLNRADDEVGLTLANVEEILRTPVRLAVPSSTDVASATNHGRPIVLSRPDHKVSRAIRHLASEIASVTLTSPAPVAEEKPTKRGLFARARK